MDLDAIIPTQVKDPEASSIPWSDYQKAIFAEVENTSENISIEAVAGSGKTTTAIEAMKRCPRGSKILFLAFNKSIVNTLISKIPFSADAKTMNALGHGLMVRKLRAAGFVPKLNAYRLWDTARTVLSDEQWEDYGSSVVRLISLARANAFGILNSGDSNDFAEALGDYEVEIPYEFEGMACRQASLILKKLIDIKDEWEFDDQVYMPIYWGQTFPQYDVVFVDEAQDLSPIQHLMLERIADRGARIIAVGDSRQAIYGFRGADGKSMRNLANRFDMTFLPLSISYRCPKEVVKEAQKIVHHIQPSDNAKDGRVVFLDEYPDIKSYPMASMILCRTNGPIFRLALEFLQEKAPCQVKSSFGKDITKFVRSFKVKTSEELLDELTDWRDREVKRAEERKWFGKANLVKDRYEALVPFCDAFDLKIQIVAALERLLNSCVGPTLSTIHKAKGLEAKDVFILRPDLLPAPFAKTEAAIEQEMNLKYVAITRSLHTLVYLPEEE